MPPKFDLTTVRDPQQLSQRLQQLSLDLETSQKRIADLTIAMANPQISVNTILAIRSALQSTGVAPINVSALVGILSQSQRGFAVVADSAATLPSPALMEVGTIGAVLVGTTLTFYLVTEGMPRSWVAQTGLAVSSVDATFTIDDNVDPTKKIRFEAGSISAGNTRVQTVPDTNQILAGRNVDNAFSALETFAAGISVSAAGISITGGQFASTTQFAVNAYLSGADQTLADSTLTAIQFNAEAFDRGTMHDNAVNNTRLTIPAGGGGLYLFIGQITYSSDSGGQRRAVITGNGAVDLTQTYTQPVATDSTTVHAYALRAVNAADYVELFGYQDTGGNLDALAGVSSTWFAAYKLC